MGIEFQNMAAVVTENVRRYVSCLLDKHVKCCFCLTKSLNINGTRCKHPWILWTQVVICSKYSVSHQILPIHISCSTVYHRLGFISYEQGTWNLFCLASKVVYICLFAEFLQPTHRCGWNGSVVHQCRAKGNIYCCTFLYNAYEVTFLNHCD